MQLRLSSILALSALAVCLLSQADWKPYSLSGPGAVASSEEERSGTILAEIVRGRLWSRIFSANKPRRSEVLASRNESSAREPKVAKTPDLKIGEVIGQIAEVIGQRADKITNVSTLARAGHAAHASALVDDIAATVRIDFSEHSPVVLIARNRGKIRLMGPDKSLMNVNISDIVIRQLQKEARRAERSEPAEEDDTKCPTETEVKGTQGSEQAERFDSRP
jgi:hypothetical protein